MTICYPGSRLSWTQFRTAIHVPYCCRYDASQIVTGVLSITGERPSKPRYNPGEVLSPPSSQLSHSDAQSSEEAMDCVRNFGFHRENETTD